MTDFHYRKREYKPGESGVGLTESWAKSSSKRYDSLPQYPWPPNSIQNIHYDQELKGHQLYAAHPLKAYTEVLV